MGRADGLDANNIAVATCVLFSARRKTMIPDSKSFTVQHCPQQRGYRHHAAYSKQEVNTEQH